MMDLKEQFTRILCYFGIRMEEAAPDASFSKEFEFGELQFRCLALHLENFFRITIGKEEYPQLDTLRGAMSLVSRKLSE